MQIAVGMYLPFHSTAAIFVGGVIKWILDKSMDKKKATVEGKRKAENTGVFLQDLLLARH